MDLYGGYSEKFCATFVFTDKQNFLIRQEKDMRGNTRSRVHKGSKAV